jgi:hypothetical protein
MQDKIKKEIFKINRCLAAMKSCILSGEKFSPSLEGMMEEAYEVVDRILDKEEPLIKVFGYTDIKEKEPEESGEYIVVFDDLVNHDGPFPGTCTFIPGYGWSTNPEMNPVIKWMEFPNDDTDTDGQEDDYYSLDKEKEDFELGMNILTL